MVDGGLNGERLAEVSRLAGVLADQVQREHGDGETGLAAVAAAEVETVPEDREAPLRLFPRLIQSLRPLRG